MAVCKHSVLRVKAGQWSVVHLLRQREMELDSCCVERLGCKITRTVILQPSMEFVGVWKKESKKSICIGLDRRIYLDKYQKCFHVEGRGGEPRELYQLPKGPLSMNIRSMILYNCHIRRHPHTLEEHRACLLVQTTDGYMKVLDANTGEVLKSVFVSSIIKFSSLDWADYYHTVQLKSNLHPNRQPSRRQGGRGGEGGRTERGGRGGEEVGREGGTYPLNQRHLIIVVFKIHPLELVASISIDRNIFGEDIKDAELSEDVLVVTHSNRVFKFYSFVWIIQHCTVLSAKLGQVVETQEGRSGRVGEPGFGVPITIKMTERPPLLFEVKSSLGYGVQFGGCPAVYSHNGLPGAPYVFHIRTLAGDKLVGAVESNTLSIHPDSANFHFDNYQRFIHINGCTYSSYNIDVVGGQPQRLVKQYSVDFKEQYQRERVADMAIRTSSGRVIKRRRPTEDEFDDLSSALHKVELEDEVDLVYAVVTLPAGDDTVAMLLFIDDKTGEILKKVPIPTWQQGTANFIDYELDCILHMIEDQGHSTCHYYRLTRRTCE